MRIPRKGSQAHLSGSDSVFCLDPPVPLDQFARIRTTARHEAWAQGATAVLWAVCSRSSKAQRVPDREGRQRPAAPSRFYATSFPDDHANPRNLRLPPSRALFVSTVPRRHRCRCCRCCPEEQGRRLCPRAWAREDDKGEEVVRARPREPALG